jgi:hypothetical protein
MGDDLARDGRAGREAPRSERGGRNVEAIEDAPNLVGH